MPKIKFYKFQASGNDFVLIDGRKLTHQLKWRVLAKQLCRRRFGIGGDGLLLIGKSKLADFKMSIFNPDGSEAEMCGNGARCVSLWASFQERNNLPKFETKAGVIEAQVKSKFNLNNSKNFAQVKIKMTEPVGLRLKFNLSIRGKGIRANYINTGVPHTIIFVEGLEKIDVENLGRVIRYHKEFSPKGTNVDFVEILKDDLIKIRTYERGVEKETLACGSGAVASAIVSTYQQELIKSKFTIKVITQGGEILKVYFIKNSDKIEDVWLEGKAYFVYKGEVEI
ncbi:MAG: diaminopimelate epimerase [Candidatus Omnitrophica bacterium]|nr:diaminopimelate epimerase [Candidatus Omnitrophota bacterium]MCM8823573.1 diaminopimelate epimerase [Candidatus Omnitrophota bacterium]MCM8825944.1 diaminopimelate epimerase [Candidatus Omnitrophota bacterium]